MPRHARQKSKTGIYHVVMRGINRQTIFEDDEDNERFLETIKKYKAISGYKLYAYCLMCNHFHLLLKVEKEEIGTIIRRIAGSYVYWYNLKYRRSGHLFQDRYRRESVANDKYFMAVLRYIHNNPLKAGLCKELSEYRYSSYNDYSSEDAGLVDIGFLYSITDKDSFSKFSKETQDDGYLDVSDESTRLNDADAGVILRNVSNCGTAAEFQSLEIPQRNRFIRELKDKGLSIRQISRLTGISFGIVRMQ